MPAFCSCDVFRRLLATQNGFVTPKVSPQAIAPTGHNSDTSQPFTHSADGFLSVLVINAVRVFDVSGRPQNDGVVSAKRANSDEILHHAINDSLRVQRAG